MYASPHLRRAPQLADNELRPEVLHARRARVRQMLGVNAVAVGSVADAITLGYDQLGSS